MFEEEIEQTNLTIASKRLLQSKLEDELEQYDVKINRADQLVCSKKNFNRLFNLVDFHIRSNVINKSVESNTVMKILNKTNLISIFVCKVKLIKRLNNNSYPNA